MSAKLLSGVEVAASINERTAAQVRELRQKGIVPGLGTILVGDDPASAGYVRKKHELCAQLGIESFHRQVAVEEGQEGLLRAIEEFNEDPRIDAYIVQYPVPEGFDFNEAMLRIRPDKDADGMHPVNLGKLVLQAPGPLPCTPAGIVAMFEYYGIRIAGKEVVVVGRGPTLGRPLALLLSSKGEWTNAAVTVVHSGVKDIGSFTRRADVVVSAVGIPSIITPDMVKPGAVVVSGGITWEGRRLLPDVDESVGEVASWITPRLGGVGPTTVAMLMKNTVEAAQRRAQQKR